MGEYNPTQADRLPGLRLMAEYARNSYKKLADVPADDLEWAVKEIARLRYLLAVETDGEDCAAHDLQALDRTADGEVIYE